MRTSMQTADWTLIAERLSSLEEIIDWHVRGTRHHNPG